MTNFITCCWLTDVYYSGTNFNGFFFVCPCRGRVILGYSETELCMKGSGYQFIHAADMMYCADNHIRSMFAIWT